MLPAQVRRIAGGAGGEARSGASLGLGCLGQLLGFPVGDRRPLAALEPFLISTIAQLPNTKATRHLQRLVDFPGYFPLGLEYAHPRHRYRQFLIAQKGGSLL